MFDKEEKDIFDNGDFILMIDGMSKRYKCLPSDFLFLSVKEFNFNVAVYTFSLMDERDRRLGVEKKTTDFKRFGFNRKVVKKEKS